jgi:hypothetical protein
MLSFLQRSSNGTAQTSVREAYRQRLQEIAASTLVPSTPALGKPGAEAGLPDVPSVSRLRTVEEKHPLPTRPAGELADFPVKIAQSLTECPPGALTGLDRQTTLDRERLRAALGKLDSLAGDVQSLDAEFGQIRELCRAVQERIRTQAETVAALEQTVRSQAEFIETRVKAALRQASQRFEALTLALDAHAEAAGKPNAVVN